MISKLSLSTILRFSFASLLFWTISTPAHSLDLNEATKAQLRSIKGIGDKTAERILSIRKQGRFLSLDDFGARVPGFGSRKLQKLRAQGVTAGSPAGPSYSRADDVAHAESGSGQSVPVSRLTQSITANPVSGSGRHGAGATTHQNGTVALPTPAMPMLIRPQPRMDAGAATHKSPASEPGTGELKRPIEQRMTP